MRLGWRRYWAILARISASTSNSRVAASWLGSFTTLRRLPSKLSWTNTAQPNPVACLLSRSTSVYLPVKLNRASRSSFVSYMGVLARRSERSSIRLSVRRLLRGVPSAGVHQSLEALIHLGVPPAGEPLAEGFQAQV